MHLQEKGEAVSTNKTNKANRKRKETDQSSELRRRTAAVAAFGEIDPPLAFASKRGPLCTWEMGGKGISTNL
jgi:hypothetical protein